MNLQTFNSLRKVAGSIPDEVIGFFCWANPSIRTMALGSKRKADKLTADCLENVGASTSHNHMGLHGLLQG
jgi:hypothetical protein